MNHCMRHYEEPVAATCRTCHRPFCTRCLVYAFGPDKPPYCIGCALAASGVRGSLKNQIPVLTEEAAKVDRAQRRAERAQARATTRALKKAAKKGGKPILGDGPEARSTAVPAPANIATPAASRYTHHDDDLPVT